MTSTTKSRSRRQPGEKRARRRRITLPRWASSQGVLVLVGAGIVCAGSVGYLSLSSARPAYGESNWESVPTQFPEHIQPGESHEPYNSDPPTSGSHYSEPAPPGFTTRLWRTET